MSTEAIQLYSRLPNPLEAVEKMGNWLARSGMFNCSKPEQGMVIALTCMSEGITIVEHRRKYHVLFNGDLALRADYMLADFNRAGGKHKIIARTPALAEVDLTWDGSTVRFAFSWSDAEKEPFVWGKVDPKTGKREVKDNYATPRTRMQMLWARCISDAIRALAPQIVAGIQTPEEHDDLPANGTTIKLAPDAHPTVTVEAEIMPETLTPKPAPVPSPTVEPVKTPSQTPPVPQNTGAKVVAMTPELAAQLHAALTGSGVNLADANLYMIAQGWLEPGDMPDELSPAKAKAIVERTAGFKGAVENWKATQGKAAA